MALRAGYYGIKKALNEKLKNLPGFSAIGTGLQINSDGELEATGATMTIDPNPEGSATESLEKLQIGETIYGVNDNTKCYQTDDSTESAIVDADYVPFYDTSASTPKKSTWSNFVSKIQAKLTAFVDWSSYAKTGAKNRLGMTLAYLKSINTQGTWVDNAYTHNGVTYTVTETDGYVSNININGTTGSSYSKMNIIGSSYVANKYKGMRLTGAPNGSGSTYYITTFYSNDGSSTVGSESKSYGVDGVVLDTENYIQTLIYIAGGVNVSSVDLQIMVCDANDTDRTFAPYAMTNRELTELATPESSEVSTGLNGFTVDFAKCGHLAQFTIVGGTLAADVAANEVIFETPDGYKPKIPVEFVNTADGKRFMVSTSGNGRVIPANHALTAGYVLRGTATYVV